MWFDNILRNAHPTVHNQLNYISGENSSQLFAFRLCDRRVGLLAVRRAEHLRQGQSLWKRRRNRDQWIRKHILDIEGLSFSTSQHSIIKVII